MTFDYNPKANIGANNVTNEPKTLVPPPNVSPVRYNFTIPKYAPYFLESLRVFITPTAESFSNFTLGQQVELQQGRDFFPCLRFDEASIETGREVFGGIYFVDPSLAGALSISYMSLGGVWMITQVTANAFVTAQAVNPLLADWYTAFSFTGSVPVVDYDYKVEEPINFSSLSGILVDLAAVIASSSGTKSPLSFDKHIVDYANPHKTTAAKVGLGNVPNWRLATATEAENGSSSSAFMSPALAHRAIWTGIVVPLGSSTVLGTTRLNIGQEGHGNDSVWGMTAAGLLAFKNAVSGNAIKQLFNVERQIVYFTPAPIAYPTVCLGATCNNFSDLVAAVENSLKLHPVQASASRYCVFLPKNVSTPNLTCTPV